MRISFLIAVSIDFCYTIISLQYVVDSVVLLSVTVTFVTVLTVFIAFIVTRRNSVDGTFTLNNQMESIFNYTKVRGEDLIDMFPLTLKSSSQSRFWLAASLDA